MIWIVLVIAVVFFFLWRSSSGKADSLQKHVVSSVADQWLHENDISLESVRFEVYYGRPYTLLSDGAVVVGFGTKSNGASAGFICDVSPQHGLMSGDLISPTVASNHKQASLQSMQSGLTIGAILKVASEKLMKNSN